MKKPCNHPLGDFALLCFESRPHDETTLADALGGFAGASIRGKRRGPKAYICVAQDLIRSLGLAELIVQDEHGWWRRTPQLSNDR